MFSSVFTILVMLQTQFVDIASSVVVHKSPALLLILATAAYVAS